MVVLYQTHQIVSLAQDISLITMQPKSEALIYAAGQYIQVINGANAIPLSIANAPHSAHLLTFHLFHPVYNVQARELLKLAEQDQSWSLTGPNGICTVDRLSLMQPIIFIAEGTGFAPIKAIFEEILLERRIATPIIFYWYGKSSSFYMTNWLQTLAHEFPHFSYQLADASEMNLATFTQQLLQAHPLLSSYSVYVAASKKTMHFLFTTFIERGLPAAHFHSDLLT